MHCPTYVGSVLELSVTLWTVARQAPLSTGFPRKLEWLPSPPPVDLPGPGMEPTSLECPALAGGFFTTEPLGAAHEQHNRGERVEPACPWEGHRALLLSENSECQEWQGRKGHAWGGGLPAADGVTQAWAPGRGNVQSGKNRG